MPLNWDFHYVERKRNGYYGRQVFNSAKPSTYVENYRFKSDRNWAMLYAGLGLIAIVIFIGAFEYGLLNFLKPLFI